MCKTGDTLPLVIGGRVRDIDRCICRLVRTLNNAGYETVASCCGHGHRPGNIALADGRELVIAKDYEEAREIDKLFPLDINGDNVADRVKSDRKRRPRREHKFC